MLSILVSGKAGVGKTTFSNFLVGYLPKNKTYIIPFALGVKEVARTGFGWNGCKDDEGRKLLQEVGAVGRRYDKDIWVKQALEVAKYRRYSIHDDWRFPNELNYFRNNNINTLTIRIEAPDRESLKGSPLYTDISETSLPSATTEVGISANYYDIIIYNNLDISLDTLSLMAREVACDILLKESRNDPN